MVSVDGGAGWVVSLSPGRSSSKGLGGGGWSDLAKGQSPPGVTTSHSFFCGNRVRDGPSHGFNRGNPAGVLAVGSQAVAVKS
jgi:hypothetical protein